MANLVSTVRAARCVFGAALLAAVCLFAGTATAAPPKPNVILIYTDDQGSIDVNTYGAKDLITPHMDDLARRGIRFTQFYAVASSDLGPFVFDGPVTAGQTKEGEEIGLRKPADAPSEFTQDLTLPRGGHSPGEECMVNVLSVDTTSGC